MLGNNYNFPYGWYVTSNDRWTLPFGGGVGKLPINLQLQAFDNVLTPQRGGADWQLGFQVQILFPK